MPFNRGALSFLGFPLYFHYWFLSILLFFSEEVVENNSHTLVDEYMASQECCLKRPRIGKHQSFHVSVIFVMGFEFEKTCILCELALLLEISRSLHSMSCF